MSVKKRNIIIIVSVILAVAIISVSIAVPLSLKKKNSDGGGNFELPTISLDGPKSIVSDALNENAAIFSSFKISSCYGVCNNYKFPVTAKITKPDTSVVTTKKEFVAETAGVYQVELSSQIGDELVTKNINVTVGGYDSEYLFSRTSSSMLGNGVRVSAEGVDNIDSDYTVGSQFSLLSSGSVIKYKNVVDLNTVSGNLIELVPNIGTNWFEITAVTVRLTDAYDSSNFITVNYVINSNNRTSEEYAENATLSCAFIQVGFNGITAANSNYAPVANTTIAFGQQFFAQHCPKNSAYPLQFRYDNATNCIYTTIDRNTKDFLVLDLDDPTDNYEDFKGFKTGEVYVSVESAGSAGNVVITKIGNDIFADVTEENYSKDNGCLLAGGYDFENMLDGIVGYAYPLPVFANQNGIAAKLEVLEGSEYVDITDQLANGFTPTKAGQYKIAYKANNLYGYEKSVGGTFTVKDNPNDIVESTSVNLTADLMGVFEIPELSFVGGIGSLRAEYAIAIDGVEFAVEPGQAISFTKKGSIVKLGVTVRDDMNYKKSFSYDIAINSNITKFELIDSFEKVTLVSGSEFVVPGYIAIDYSKDDISQNNIDVVIKRGRTRTVSVGDVLEITSDTTLNYTIDGVTVKTISIKCVPQEIDADNGIDKQFGSITGVDNVSTNDIGTGFVVNGNNVSFEMPYVVSTSNLNISFSVFADARFTSVRTIVRSLNGKDIVLELKNLGSKPVLWINGVETPYQISIKTDLYNQADASGLYGKRYYNYSFVIDGAKGNLYNGEMVKIANIDTWSNKLAYDGFDKACAKVSFQVSGGNAGDVFVLDTVSNQRFTTIHLENGEVMAPAIAMESELSSMVVKVGDTIHIPYAYAYDVLDNLAEIRMSVYDSEGTAIVNNMLPTEYDLTITKYGTYSLVYTISDSKYNTEKVRYTFVVQDNVAPTISLNGSYNDSYKQKDGVTVIGATATDNNNDVVGLVIWLEYSDLKTVVVSQGQHLSLAAGKYTIVYYAMDGDGNATIQKYEFEVKGGRK